MSVEVSVYTAEPPLRGTDLIAAAAKKRHELRLLIPFKCIGLAPEALQQPLKKQDLMVYCWPKRDTKTTAILNEALQKGDTSLFCLCRTRSAGLTSAARSTITTDIGRSTPTNWRSSRNRFPPKFSRRCGRPRRYFFRCGLRPQQNANYLDTVAKIVRDLTNGYLGE